MVCWRARRRGNGLDQISGISENRGVRQLYGGRPAAELHPIRRQSRHQWAGGGAGGNAAEPQPGRRDPDGGRLGADALYSGDLPPATEHRGTGQGSAGTGDRRGAGGGVHQRVGAVDALHPEKLSGAVSQH